MSRQKTAVFKLIFLFRTYEKFLDSSAILRMNNLLSSTAHRKSEVAIFAVLSVNDRGQLCELTKLVLAKLSSPLQVKSV